MSLSNYALCHFCGGKTIYIGDQHVPDGRAGVHIECLDAATALIRDAGEDEGRAKAAAGLRERLATAERERDVARVKAQHAIGEAIKVAEAQLVVIDQRDAMRRERDEARAIVAAMDGPKASALSVEVLKLWDRHDAMLRERDQAIAHDRQPYPTADAYEGVCRALRKHRAIADAATAALVRSSINPDEAERLRREFTDAITDRPDAGSLANRLTAAEDELIRAWAERDAMRHACAILDAEDVTDWQRGYRACSERVLAAASADAGEHRYLSTACHHAAEPGRHDLHAECQRDDTRWDGTHKTAATCKWCPAPCVCGCHASPPDVGHLSPASLDLVQQATGGTGPAEVLPAFEHALPPDAVRVAFAELLLAGIREDAAYAELWPTITAAVDQLAAASPSSATEAGERGEAAGQGGAGAQRGAEDSWENYLAGGWNRALELARAQGRADAKAELDREMT